MPDAADRIRAAPPASGRLPGFVRALAPRSKRGVAGAALVALMIGIVVNAVALQHGRRVEAAPDPAPVAAPVAAAKPVAPPAPVAAPTPPQPSPNALARVEKSDDPIAALLLRQTSADKRKLTLSAQSALIKLGYDLKPTGAVDADTKSALTQFQKKHKLPITAEITAKLVKALNAAEE